MAELEAVTDFSFCGPWDSEDNERIEAAGTGGCSCMQDTVRHRRIGTNLKVDELKP